MKVVLLHDIPKVGRKYEVKTVADGFAQNSLLPDKKALVATPGVLKQVETMRKQHEAEEKVKLDLLGKNFTSLNGVTVEIEAVANDKGHLFSSIHKSDLVKALNDQKRVQVPEVVITLEKPIKEVGDHAVEVAVGDKKGTFTVRVKAVKAK